MQGLSQFLKAANNPEQICTYLLQSNPRLRNNPMLRNAMDMVRNGNEAGLRDLAMNLANAKGVNLEDLNGH